MNADQKMQLAEELAGTFAQFRRAHWQFAANKEIKQSEFLLLFALKHAMNPADRGVKISDLSVKMQITPAAITHMVNSLEDSGYLERLADATDRRVVLIRLTPEGEKLLARMRLEYMEHLQGLVGHLGEQDSKHFIRLLSTAFKYIKERQQ